VFVFEFSGLALGVDEIGSLGDNAHTIRQWIDEANGGKASVGNTGVDAETFEFHLVTVVFGRCDKNVGEVALA